EYARAMVAFARASGSRSTWPSSSAQARANATMARAYSTLLAIHSVSVTRPVLRRSSTCRCAAAASASLWGMFALLNHNDAGYRAFLVPDEGNSRCAALVHGLQYGHSLQCQGTVYRGGPRRHNLKLERH